MSFKRPTALLVATFRSESSGFQSSIPRPHKSKWAGEKSCSKIRPRQKLDSENVRFTLRISKSGMLLLMPGSSFVCQFDLVVSFSFSTFGVLPGNEPQLSATTTKSLPRKKLFDSVSLRELCVWVDRFGFANMAKIKKKC